MTRERLQVRMGTSYRIFVGTLTRAVSGRTGVGTRMVSARADQRACIAPD
jgi:hypothetical protein